MSLCGGVLDIFNGIHNCRTNGLLNEANLKPPRSLSTCPGALPSGYQALISRPITYAPCHSSGSTYALVTTKLSLPLVNESTSMVADLPLPPQRPGHLS